MFMGRFRWVLIIIIIFIFLCNTSAGATIHKKFIDPIIEKDLKKYERESLFESIKSYLSKEKEGEYDILVCSKEPIKNEKILFKTRNCYWYGKKKVNLKKIMALRKNKDIISIMTSKKYVPTLEYAIPFTSGNLSYYDTTPRNFLYYKGKIINGSNVRIAIIDTGINTSESWFGDAKIIYKGRIYYDSQVGCIEDTKSYADYDGHGTHVAGIAHAIAPGAELIILKPYDDTTGTFSDVDIICAINKALELNASIISLSLGGFPIFTDCDEMTDSLCYYISQTITSYPEVIFSIAAGNEGDNKMHFGNYLRNSTVNLTYLKDAVDDITMLIRWYNTSKIIKKIEIIDALNADIIGIVGYNGTDYIFNYTYNPSASSLYYFCTQNQCILFIDIQHSNEEYNITISSEEMDYDVYAYDVFTMNENTLLPNNNSRSILTPGINPFAFTVGSIASHIYDSGKPHSNIGEISFFSSRGDVKINDSYPILKPDIVAPGEQILSASAYYGSYGCIMAGTSMSTPFFSGVLALIKQILPSITTKEIRENIGNITDKDSYSLMNFAPIDKGYGLINISKVLLSLPEIHIGSIAIEVYNPNISNYTLILNVSLIRGSFRAKIANETLLPNETKNMSFSYTIPENLTAGNYTFQLSINGEFINSPYKEIINLTAYSNISYRNLRIWMDNDTYNVTLTLLNYGFPTMCNLTLNDTTLPIRINSTKRIEFTNNRKCDDIEVSCINNIGIKNIPLAELHMNISTANLSIFDNLTINITHTILFPYKLIRYHARIGEKEYVVENLSTLTIPIIDFMKNQTYNYNLSLKAEIIKPNNESVNVSLARNLPIAISIPLNISIYAENTNNPKYIGINSTISININLTKNITSNISYRIVFLNNTIEFLTTNTSVNLSWKPNLTNFTGNDNISANLSLFLIYKNKTLFLKNISFFVDLKPPEFLLKNTTNIEHILLPLKINESNLYEIKIEYENFTKKYSSNEIQEFLLLDICKNITLNITLEDIAKNYASYILNASCIPIPSNSTYNLTRKYVYAMHLKEDINISQIPVLVRYEKQTTKITIEGDKKKYTLNKSIKLIPNTKDVFVIINFTIPSGGYDIKSIYKINTTEKEITNQSFVSSGMLFISLNLSTDPLIYVVFYKEEKIKKSKASSGSSHSYRNIVSSGAISESKNQTSQIKHSNKKEPSWKIINQTENTIEIEILENCSFEIPIYNISILLSFNKTKEEKGYLKITYNKILKTIKLFLEVIGGKAKIINISSKNITQMYIICINNTKMELCSLPINIKDNFTIAIKEKEILKAIYLNKTTQNQYAETSKEETTKSLWYYAAFLFCTFMIYIFIKYLIKLKS